jgi:hypothetical protein
MQETPYKIVFLIGIGENQIELYLTEKAILKYISNLNPRQANSISVIGSAENGFSFYDLDVLKNKIDHNTVIYFLGHGIRRTQTGTSKLGFLACHNKFGRMQVGSVTGITKQISQDNENIKLNIVLDICHANTYFREMKNCAIVTSFSKAKFSSSNSCLNSSATNRIIEMAKLQMQFNEINPVNMFAIMLKGLSFCPGATAIGLATESELKMGGSKPYVFKILSTLNKEMYMKFAYYKTLNAPLPLKDAYEKLKSITEGTINYEQYTPDIQNMLQNPNSLETIKNLKIENINDYLNSMLFHELSKKQPEEGAASFEQPEETLFTIKPEDKQMISKRTNQEIIALTKLGESPFLVDLGEILYNDPNRFLQLLKDGMPVDVVVSTSNKEIILPPFPAIFAVVLYQNYDIAQFILDKEPELVNAMGAFFQGKKGAITSSNKDDIEAFHVSSLLYLASTTGNLEMMLLIFSKIPQNTLIEAFEQKINFNSQTKYKNPSQLHGVDITEKDVSSRFDYATQLLNSYKLNMFKTAFDKEKITHMLTDPKILPGLCLSQDERIKLLTMVFEKDIPEEAYVLLEKNKPLIEQEIKREKKEKCFLCDKRKPNEGQQSLCNIF